MADRIYQVFILITALLMGLFLSTHLVKTDIFSILIHDLQNFFKAMIPILGAGALIKYLLS